MPSRTRRIEVLLSVHTRLRLEDAEDRDLHEGMLCDLIGEALAPLQGGGSGELRPAYRLSDPDTARLAIEGDGETQTILTAVLRAVDLFARPKPDELADGSAFNDRRLYTQAEIVALESASGARDIAFAADSFAVVSTLPAWLAGESVRIVFAGEGPSDPDAVAEMFEAFLQDSCAVPRERIDAWLFEGGDEVSVWAEDDDDGTVLRIAGYHGEGSALALLAASVSGTVELSDEDD